MIWKWIKGLFRRKQTITVQLDSDTLLEATILQGIKKETK